jgi:hypothetical protein
MRGSRKEGNPNNVGSSEIDALIVRVCSVFGGGSEITARNAMIAA